MAISRRLVGCRRCSAEVAFWPATPALATELAGVSSFLPGLLLAVARFQKDGAAGDSAQAERAAIYCSASCHPRSMSPEETKHGALVWQATGFGGTLLQEGLYIGDREDGTAVKGMGNWAHACVRRTNISSAERDLCADLPDMASGIAGACGAWSRNGFRDRGRCDRCGSSNGEVAGDVKLASKLAGEAARFRKGLFEDRLIERPAGESRPRFAQSD